MDKEKFMKIALKEAKKAFEKEEIPVGAVIVKDGEIIAKAHNLKETKQSAMAHAEILAISKANKKLNNWRLSGCEMYVTLKPCAMCMGAIISSRIKKVYFGVDEIKQENRIINNENNAILETGILKEECEYILKDFFKKRRIK